MTIKPGHPKVWLDPARLQWLKANPKRLEWTRLLTNCEDDIHRVASALPPASVAGRVEEAPVSPRLRKR